MAWGEVDASGTLVLSEDLLAGDYKVHILTRDSATNYQLSYERSPYLPPVPSAIPPETGPELKRKVILQGQFYGRNNEDSHTFTLAKTTRVTFAGWSEDRLSFRVFRHGGGMDLRGLRVRGNVSATYRLRPGTYTARIEDYARRTRSPKIYALTITPENERNPVVTDALQGRAERNAKFIMRRTGDPDVLANSKVLKLTVKNTRRVRIKATQSQASRMRVYDARGRVVATSRNGSRWTHAIRKRLQTGTYFVQLFSPKVDVQRYNLSVR